MHSFIDNDLSAETLWRSIILFGKNTATYKFAFAKALLDYAEKEKTVLTLEDLSEPFSKYLIQHLTSGNHQGVQGDFINTLERYIQADDVSHEEVLDITRRKGFVNVINAFQNVQGGVVPRRFYDGKYQGINTKITLTDGLFKLKETLQFDNFFDEVEARWRLVETAWNLNISPAHLEVEYDELGEELFIETDVMKRIDVSNARDALNGYQKGRCFYCCADISLRTKSIDLCHVDHFHPHKNKKQHLPANINGVWNLVLSCSTCNGSGEKGGKVPDLKYLDKLSERNEYYISSKHPLAETIINQTGKAYEQRRGFLNTHYRLAKESSVHTWSPSYLHEGCYE